MDDKPYTPSIGHKHFNFIKEITGGKPKSDKNVVGGRHSKP